MRGDHGAAVRLPGLIALRLGGDVLDQPLPLRFAEGAERIVEERGIKCDARRVELLDNRNIQALLREQDFDVTAAARGWNGGIEQRLRKKAAAKSEGLVG